jgi:hypothetical protein
MTATRNIGVMVVFSVGILALQAYGWRELVKFGDRGFRVILAIWFIPLVMFAYMFYMHYHVGDAFLLRTSSWHGDVSSVIRSDIGLKDLKPVGGRSICQS